MQWCKVAFIVKYTYGRLGVSIVGSISGGSVIGCW